MDVSILGRTFTLKECGRCGIEFLVPAAFERDCREEGERKTWYCPNGHPRVFRERESDQLRRECNILKQQQARLEDEKREALDRAIKAEAATKRLKARRA